MNSALYIGATGMKSLSQGMQVITNNLANVSTIGFKQQGILFSELMSTEQAGMGGWWGAQENSRVALGQTGLGVQVEAVRTLFGQGGLQASNTLTDMAINGKGFFQVSNDEGVYYTRAGDFRFDNEGTLRTPAGEALNGFKINPDGTKGELAPVVVDKFGTIAPKASTSAKMGLNLGLADDRTKDVDNPYFGLLNAYSAGGKPPLNAQAYGYSEAMTLYDATGASHQVTVYFDKSPGTPPDSTMEYLIAEQVPEPEPGQTVEPGAGLLMSGTLSFNSSGQLKDMSAFTPGTPGSKDLAAWQPATLAGGLPQFTIGGAPVTMDFGLSAKGGWQNPPASAADVGANPALLPGMGKDVVRSPDATTARKGTSTTVVNSQNGYAEGTLSHLSINTDGTVQGHYSNSQTVDLWEIPVCRFTSEDGLRREGNNLFSAAPEAGAMEMGVAGTENYGKIMANNIESSNVDMSTEMVNMIVTQRGFQSNSKSVTTADQMLQKAMELKR